MCSLPPQIRAGPLQVGGRTCGRRYQRYLPDEHPSQHPAAYFEVCLIHGITWHCTLVPVWGLKFSRNGEKVTVAEVGVIQGVQGVTSWSKLDLFHITLEEAVRGIPGIEWLVGSL
jgi:hypothetical protein